MNRNFDLRSKLYDIRRSDLEMIHTARRVGASAKFAGSGGAIVGTYEDDVMYQRLRDAVTQANPNWRIVRPVVV
jgi:glucuronokinase